MPWFMVLKMFSPWVAMAVPIWMAVAPARMNSMASWGVVIPPQPMMGTLTAWCIS